MSKVKQVIPFNESRDNNLQYNDNRTVWEIVEINESTVRR